MMRRAPGLAAGRETARGGPACQSRMRLGGEKIACGTGISEKIDHQSGDDATEGEHGKDDDDDSQPIDGFGARRFFIGPRVPCPIGFGACAVVMTQGPHKPVLLFLGEQAFHDLLVTYEPRPCHTGKRQREMKHSPLSRKHAHRPERKDACKAGTDLLQDRRVISRDARLVPVPGPGPVLPGAAENAATAAVAAVWPHQCSSKTQPTTRQRRRQVRKECESWD